MRYNISVQATDWRDRKDGKQAELLLEHSFPFALVERIGVRTEETRQKVCAALAPEQHRMVQVIRKWYY